MPTNFDKEKPWIDEGDHYNEEIHANNTPEPPEDYKFKPLINKIKNFTKKATTRPWNELYDYDIANENGGDKHDIRGEMKREDALKMPKYQPQIATIQNSINKFIKGKK